jgi:hypothetical protein
MQDDCLTLRLQVGGAIRTRPSAHRGGGKRNITTAATYGGKLAVALASARTFPDALIA